MFSPVTPTFFDPHVCCPRWSAALVGCEMDFECACGRQSRLEHYLDHDGGLLGPAWILF